MVSCKGRCGVYLTGTILLIIGGINWGLVGIGMLAGGDVSSWNVIHKLLVSMPMIEGIVYVLVGIAAVLGIFGCRCKKCSAAHASCCGGETGKMEGASM